MEVTVQNHQKKLSLNCPQITRNATKILQHEELEHATLALVFVTGQKIRALNKKYLHQSVTTDVLAFEGSGPLGNEKPGGKRPCLYGDIIISTDAVLQNSRIYRTTPSYELTLYIAHGILHLLGYDDHKKIDIQKMRAKEKEVMEFLGRGVNFLCQVQ
ncbi:MAG: rRNA maturation RNase YbeY [Candidatus Omnitrophica bacterium]|nr:rRNA maturation RNase YbeY [Candidatus Omnitrophota bacterium]